MVASSVNPDDAPWFFFFFFFFFSQVSVPLLHVYIWISDDLFALLKWEG